MIKTLRKRHLQIWTLLAVLIPVGIIVAWLAVPPKATDKLLQPAAIDLPALIKVNRTSKQTADTLNLKQ
jgi:hypothetical protein